MKKKKILILSICVIICMIIYSSLIIGNRENSMCKDDRIIAIITTTTPFEPIVTVKPVVTIEPENISDQSFDIQKSDKPVNEINKQEEIQESEQYINQIEETQESKEIYNKQDEILQIDAIEFTVTDIEPITMYSKDALNIRSKPYASSEKVGELVKTEAVTVTGIADTGWYRIYYNDMEAYVSNNYVSDKYFTQDELLGMLTGDSPSKKYNYCPSVMMNGSPYIWFCQNSQAGIIKDYIYCKTADIFGTISEYVALKPTIGSWDSEHVCDPSVIQGNFSFSGTTYSYLMAYLGCSSTDNQDNAIGLAVSNSPSGPWVKVSTSAPFRSLSRDYEHNDIFQWGVGQPCLINIDKSSRVLLCYTQGTWNLTSEIAEIWNLSDLDNPVLESQVTVSNNGTGDFISNAEFAYTGDSLYMLCDKHPFGGSVLSNIADSTNVYMTSVELDNLSNASWSLVKSISSMDTGYAKNHNGCLIRDSFGWNYDIRQVMMTTASETNNFLTSLWTYSIRLVSW